MLRTTTLILSANNIQQCVGIIEIINFFPNESHARLVINSRIRRIDWGKKSARILVGDETGQGEVNRSQEVETYRALNGSEVSFNKFSSANPPRVNDISEKLCPFPEKSLNVSIDDTGVPESRNCREGRDARVEGRVTVRRQTETSQDRG